MTLTKAKLNRLLRVRTLQLGLVRADEARAHQRFASEAALKSRITQLAESIAPAPAEIDAFAFMAEAHFRDRLNQSAEAAETRLRAAEASMTRASEATRGAKRDQSAIEKLIARADAAELVKSIRALEAAPVGAKIRHDPC